MTPMQPNFWDQIKSRLASKISPQDFQNWVTRTAFQGTDGRILRVSVPDPVTKDWMEQEYAVEIRDAIRELNLPVERVLFLPSVSGFAPVQHTDNSRADHAGVEPIFASAGGQLNPKFRFDNYVVGSSPDVCHRPRSSGALSQHAHRLHVQ